MSLFRPSKRKRELPFDQTLYGDPFDRRNGADRRRAVDKGNGLSVLLAGCSRCDRIAPSPIDLHIEGWEMVWDEDRLVSITCPAHKVDADAPNDLPDYIVPR
jgi:hypothetical protein